MTIARRDTQQQAIRRIHRAMDFMESHRGEPIRLEHCAQMANYSRHHFVRAFASVTGETPGAHLRRIRLSLAAVRLVAWQRESILNVALSVGFDSAAVFSRAFAQQYRVSPSRWRDAGLARADTRAALTPSGLPGEVLSNIRLEFVPPMRIAYARAIGRFGLTRAVAWRELVQWLAVRGLATSALTCFAQLRDIPYVTMPRHLRFDAGIVVGPEFEGNGSIAVRQIGGGWAVAADFLGSSHDEAAATQFLHRRWLARNAVQASGEAHYVLVRRSAQVALLEPAIQDIYAARYFLPVLAPDSAPSA